MTSGCKYQPDTNMVVCCHECVIKTRVCRNQQEEGPLSAGYKGSVVRPEIIKELICLQRK